MEIVLSLCICFIILFFYASIGLIIFLALDVCGIYDFSPATVALLWPIILLILAIGVVIHGVSELMTYIKDCFDK